jgi:hypothetical protein
MAKKLSPEDQKLLDGLRDRLVLTVQFIENAQDFPSGSELRAIVENVTSKGDLRSLRLLAREIDSMTTSLAPHEREGLEAHLASRLGVDSQAERADLRRRMEAVLARGTIASEKERRRLEEYADMLEATDGDPGEIAAVRRLLAST